FWMPDSFLTTKDAPPLAAPAMTRNTSPLDRTYPVIAGLGPTYAMSMAPANRASMAEGPALKLVHWIFTLQPRAFSNHPLALPTMGCACVMLGKAPTRITVAFPWAHP